jgi:alpha-tubulin suppressor-like RCC1 family protein
VLGSTACQSDRVTGPTSQPSFAIAAATYTYEFLRAGSYNSCLNRAPIGTASYTLFCWGSNADGTVGIGTTGGNVLTPRAVTNNTGGRAWTGDVGLNHQCALFTGTTKTQAYCWGDNVDGQLGDGTTTERNVPTLVKGDINWRQISPGYHHTCAVNDIGVAYCWGRGALGVLGNGGTANKLVPTPVNTAIAFSAIYSGENFTCGRAQGSPAAAIYCWGYNGYGQLGINSNVQQLQPGPAVVGGAKWIQDVTVGSSHACALSYNPVQTYCWGHNGYGQLGIGTTTNQRSPVVVGISVQPIAAGGYFTCARQVGTGKMYCWGRGDLGALGNGFFVNRLTPYPVYGDFVYQQSTTIGAGANHVIAKRTDGTVMAWGYNNFGQLGDGSLNTRPAPVVILLP